MLVSVGFTERGNRKQRETIGFPATKNCLLTIFLLTNLWLQTLEFLAGMFAKLSLQCAQGMRTQGRLKEMEERAELGTKCLRVYLGSKSREMT